LAQQISTSLDIEHQDFQPVVVFLNGEYWGIQTIRDRIDERFIEYTQGIDKDSVEFNVYGSPSFTSFIDFVQNNPPSVKRNYDSIQSKMDISNYIDYTIAEMFFANYDWPSNNYKAWKKINNGKWRWILYDLDGSFRAPDYNMIKHVTRNDSSVTWPNGPQSTFLFRSLIQNQTFKSQFLERYAEILNNDYNSEVMSQKLNEIKEIYQSEVPRHIERWNHPTSYSRWENDLDEELNTFLNERSCFVKKNLMSFFKLSEFNFDCRPHAQVTNNLISTPNPSNGQFYLLSSEDYKDGRITVFNTSGQVVLSKKQINMAAQQWQYIDLSELKNGLYILKVSDKGATQQMKIVISE
jgi:hypothetical protein